MGRVDSGKLKTYSKKTPRLFSKKRPKQSLVLAKQKDKDLVKLIKNVTLKQSEPKYLTINQSGAEFDVPTLNHNVLHLRYLWYNGVGVNPVIWPSQGNLRNNREGDEIIANGVMMRGVFNVLNSTRSTRLRFYYVAWNSDQGNPDVYNNFFHNITGTAVCDPIRKNRYPTLKYLGSCQVRATDRPSLTEATTGTEMYFNKFISFNDKKIKFQQATQIAGNMKENGALLISPYCTTVTTGSSPLVSEYRISFTLHYKDP